MSGINGDKSRFNRERKRRIARRIRTRKLLKSVTADGTPATSTSRSKPKTVSA
jgi:hypothetical protein